MKMTYEQRKASFDFHTTSNLVFDSHIHKQLEIVYVNEGELHVLAPNINEILSSGDTFIAFPNTLHSYGYTDNNPSNLCSLVICDFEWFDDFSAIMNSMCSKFPIVRKDKIHKDFLYCLDSISQIDADTADSKLIKGYLSVMLSRILSELTLVPLASCVYDNFIHEALVYMGKHFNEKLTLSSVSNQLGVSKYHLSHCFATSINCNFNEYLNSLRIDHAKKLLFTTNKQITEIAFECGFDSACTFYRAFKDVCGTTPRQYRCKSLECG